MQPKHYLQSCGAVSQSLQLCVKYPLLHGREIPTLAQWVQGGAHASPFQTEIYKQQYAKWCLQDPNLRSLATH